MERISPTKSAVHTSLPVTHGSLVIHSAPSALRTHIHWAIKDILGTSVQMQWRPQPNYVGTYRSEITWRDLKGNGAKLSSALASWHFLRFEIFEGSAEAGELFRFTPELGIHRAVTDLTGAVLVGQNQINAVLAESFDEESIRAGLALIIGNEWENELERFRGVNHQELSHLRAI